MKKIPTLFERIYNNHKVVGITPNVTPGCEKALTGEPVCKLKRSDFGLEWPCAGARFSRED